MSALPLKVVAIDDGYDSYETERRVLAGVGAEFFLRPCHGDAQAVYREVVDADAILARESPIDAHAISLMSRCKAIVRYGIGVDNFDLAAAKARRIYVANVPDYGTEEVSDHALALFMAVARRIVSRDGEVRKGVWGVGPAQKVYRIAGRTLGLVGYGRIAAALARKLNGLGLTRVLAYDPYAKLPEGIESVGMDDLCRQADVISVHAPLTPETRGILSRERIALLKPTAIVVNTARGPLIDEVALTEALVDRRIFGAGLDVFAQEPLRPDSRLLTLDNAVLSDHTGWYSEQSVEDLQRKAVEEAARVLSGGQPINWLNRWS